MLIACAAGVPEGQGVMDDGGAEQAILWQRWERAFTAEADADGRRVELLVEFTSPDGSTRTVRGFWDGGATWRVRFMPDEVGTWAYRATSEPAIPGLHDVAGSFECEPNAGGSAFLEHGPIRVAASGTYLEHADGTPFFWLVDTSWNGALFSDSLDWERYLGDRAGKGFTGVKFVTTQWRAAEANAEGLVAYTGHDEIEIDPAFFQRLDARVDAIERHGLLAVPVLLWALGNDDETPGRLPESEAIRLARYILARYQAHHALFILGGDGNYAGDNAARWKRIGAAVFDLPGHPLAMMHTGGMHWPYDEWRDADWVSVTAYQSGHGDDAATLRWLHSGPPATTWDQPPIRPVINLEPPYEDHIAYQSRERHTAYTVRRAMYWSLLNAPTAGVSYGAHGIWSWQTEPGTPLNHPNTGVAKVWHEAMALPGSTHAGLMAELFGGIPWWRLRPDDSLVVIDDDLEAPVRTGLTHVVYTRTADGTAVLYVDGVARGSARIGGDFSNWDGDFRLALGDEFGGGRAWLGEYRRVAVFDRAMDASEVAERSGAGHAAQVPGAVVLYDFDEGEGDTIHDRSGMGEPIDLRIESAEAVAWLPGGGIRLLAPVRIASGTPAVKVNAAVRAAGEITVEAWIAPANTTQAGPARILTLSANTGNRNFTLGQDAGVYELRLRTTATSVNGEPAVRSEADADRHIAASRTDTGDAAVVYLPRGGRVVVRTDALASGVTARWFDPRTGEMVAAAPGGEGAFTAPDEQDWVLVFAAE